MAESPTREATLRRLRANAAAAGIALTDETLARIAAGQYLGNVEAFERIVAGVPPDTLPDYLKDWNPPATPAGDAREGGRR